MLIGPDCLEVLDLSYMTIFPNDFGTRSVSDKVDPLAHTKIFNLTGSLINVANPMEFLNLSRMPELEILKIGPVTL